MRANQMNIVHEQFSVGTYCYGKRRYHSEDEAWRVAKHCKRLRKIKLTVYDCRHCRAFHLTKKKNARTYL